MSSVYISRKREEGDESLSSRPFICIPSRGLLKLLVTAFLAFALSLPYADRQEATAQQTSQPRYGGTYYRPLGNAPSTLDPARIKEIYSLSVTQQIYDGVVDFDSTLTIKPALAQSWRASRDWREWIFTLRKGVKFHHGRELTAEDVVFTLTRILDPRTRSGAADLLQGIRGANEFREGRAKNVEGIEALDRHTVRVRLVEASTPLVSILAIGHAKIVPKDVVEREGERFGLHPVGTGPFKFIKWEGREIVLEANQEYYQGRPYLDRIVYRIFPGEQFDVMLKEFEAGRLEDSPIPTSERRRTTSKKEYQFLQRPMFGLRFIGFNVRQKPLDNRLLRQAMNFAINKDAVIEEVYQNRFVVAHGVLPPGTPGYNPSLNGYRYDPKRAKELLAEAGYPGGKGLPVLHFWSAAKVDEAILEHEAIRRDLAAVGIRLEVNYNTDWPAFVKMLSEGRAPLFRYSWYADVPDPDNFLFKLFHSQSPRNYTFYQNPATDALLFQAKNQTELRQRVELYRRAEQMIMDDAPIIPMIFYTYERLFQPYVRSIEVNGLGDPYIPMRKIWLDKGK